MTTKKYFQIKKKTDKKGEIFIYGDIVSEEWFANEVTAPVFKQQLDELGNVSEIDVHINSSGGGTCLKAMLSTICLKCIKQKSIFISMH